MEILQVSHELDSFLKNEVLPVLMSKKMVWSAFENPSRIWWKE